MTNTLHLVMLAFEATCFCAAQATVFNSLWISSPQPQVCAFLICADSKTTRSLS